MFTTERTICCPKSLLHSVVNQQYFSVFLWPVEQGGASVNKVLHKTRDVGGGDGSPSTIVSVSIDVAQRQQTSNPAVRDFSLSLSLRLRGSISQHNGPDLTKRIKE